MKSHEKFELKGSLNGFFQLLDNDLCNAVRLQVTEEIQNDDSDSYKRKRKRTDSCDSDEDSSGSVLSDSVRSSAAGDSASDIESMEDESSADDEETSADDEESSAEESSAYDEDTSADDESVISLTQVLCKRVARSCSSSQLFLRCLFFFKVKRAAGKSF